MPGVPPSEAFGTRERDEAGERVRGDPRRSRVLRRRVDVALAEALHLDQPAPGERRGDREVARVDRAVGGRRRGRDRAGHVHVDVDELRAERAAERRAQVARLEPGRSRSSRSRRPGSPGCRRRRRGSRSRSGRRKLPGPLSSPVGSVTSRSSVPGTKSKKTRPLVVCGRAGRADGDDVEHARPAGHRHRDAEARRRGRRPRRRSSSPKVVSVFVAAT